MENPLLNLVVCNFPFTYHTFTIPKTSTSRLSPKPTGPALFSLINYKHTAKQYETSKMMVTTLLSIFSLAFWSVMVASQDLKSSLVTAVTHVASDHYPTPTATADYGASDVIVDLATNSSIDAVGVIPPEKDIRLSCHGLSLYLSKNEPITYYLIGHCGGVYDKPHDNRCSYLDLDL